MHPLLKEKFFNFLSTLIYLIAVGLSVYLLRIIHFTAEKISVFDLVVISLATFRLARMVVYEKVFGLIRYGVAQFLKYPFFRSLNNLITCPWCTGIWSALLLFDIYYLVPFGSYLIYFLAIAAIASPLVVLSNNLTVRNDILKKQRDNQPGSQS